MALHAPKPETTYELCPSGTHIARLYKIVNLGTHDTEWQGQAKTSAKIRLYWELPNEMKEYEKDGQKHRVTEIQVSTLRALEKKQMPETYNHSGAPIPEKQTAPEPIGTNDLPF